MGIRDWHGSLPRRVRLVGCEPSQLRYVVFHGGLAEIAHLETPGHEWAVIFLMEADNLHRRIAVDQIYNITVAEVVRMPGKRQGADSGEGFLIVIGHVIPAFAKATRAISDGRSFLFCASSPTLASDAIRCKASAISGAAAMSR